MPECRGQSQVLVGNSPKLCGRKGEGDWRLDGEQAKLASEDFLPGRAFKARATPTWGLHTQLYQVVYRHCLREPHRSKETPGKGRKRSS